MDLDRATRWRRRAAETLARAATGLHDYLEFVGLEHLPADPTPRYGHGRPPHPGLASWIAGFDRAYVESLHVVLGYAEHLAAIPRDAAPGSGPYWRQHWLPALDAAAVYSFVRARCPAQYVEAGSGTSTHFAARARADGRLATRITSIDPAPRSDVQGICDVAVRAGLESADPAIFAGLGAGDVLFVDGSHRALMNSDAVAFVLDVLPALPPGVLVGVHDILLPDDYFPSWAAYQFSEQYLLAAYLLGGARRVAPRLAAHHVSTDPALRDVLAPLWARPAFAGVDTRGWSFWFEVSAG